MEIPTVVNEALVKDNHAAQVGAVWMTLEVVPDEGKKDNAFLKAQKAAFVNEVVQYGTLKVITVSDVAPI